MTDPRRALPSVDRLVTEAARNNGAAPNAGTIADAARAVLTGARETVANGGDAPELPELVALLHAEVERRGQASLRRVINATGVVLQTNLGRAPLSERAIAAMAEAARGYTNLEFDLESGGRGSRHEHVRDLIRQTTGAEDGLVVNNNAAALFMVLQVFAAGREVIISRGQAVEIGGGFRIPDVLRQSGAILAEVGTTNRTYARDYEAAWSEITAAILRVHASNFKIVGFTAEPTLAELAEVAHARGGLLLDDLGSGCLVDTATYGIAHEPTVRESLESGADLALFSGDKLLGGPQCGIIAGKADLVEQLRRHPLARALRVDKTTIAALNATLSAYARGTEAAEVPVWRMLSESDASLKRRAQRWAKAAGTTGSVVRSRSMVGGGSLPGEGVLTWCTAIAGSGLDELARRLRTGSPAVVGRIEGGLYLLDPRTVAESDDSEVGRLLANVTAI